MNFVSDKKKRNFKGQKLNLKCEINLKIDQEINCFLLLIKYFFTIYLFLFLFLCEIAC